MTDTPRIRILLADDHDMLREGLTSFLRACPDLETVGEATDGNEAVQLCRDLHPDIVLMDLMMPELDGIAATQIITKEFPGTRVIALSSAFDDRSVKAALHAGACGYLLKNISSARLADAIRTAHSGMPVLSPEVMAASLSPSSSPKMLFPLGGELTHREREVLDQMVSGQTNAEIASRMNISLSTVKNHVSSILEKMGAANRAEVIYKVLNGL